MTRKEFFADVAAAASDLQSPQVKSVGLGKEDGEIQLIFQASPDESQIVIDLFASDVAGYPRENQFYLCTDNEAASPQFSLGLEKIQMKSAGKRIRDVISQIAVDLGSSQASRPQSPASIEMIDEDGNAEALDPHSGSEYLGFRVGDSLKTNDALNERLNEDLRLTGHEFNVGVVTDGAPTSVRIISSSIRVSQLELSKDILEAWNLPAEGYVVLLIRFLSGYLPLDEYALPTHGNSLEFRIGVYNDHILTEDDAREAFTSEAKDTTETDASNPHQAETVFHDLFISKALNRLMNQDFHNLVRLRIQHGLDWQRAMERYSAIQSAGNIDSLPLPTMPQGGPSDHLAQFGNKASLPLAATQFALHHLVHCTEYCLVCHQTIDDDIESMRPYVCKRPLCLYQFMSLGFGPSLEHEVLAQPNVVDLLISFCYSSASNGKSLRELPTGLNLKVPHLLFDNRASSDYIGASRALQHEATTQPTEGSKRYKVTFNETLRTIRFAEADYCPVQYGQWIVLRLGASLEGIHHRVLDTSSFPNVEISQSTIATPLGATLPDPLEHNERAISPEFDEAYHSDSYESSQPNAREAPRGTIAIYDVDFDSLAHSEKLEALSMLLLTVPPVQHMTDYLRSQASTSPDLSKWKSRISPAALRLLQWIIASNRSWITEVNSKEKEMVEVDGIGECVQFRFIQGSGDKEKRFRQELSDRHDDLPAAYPTIYAWHGSPLENWHSIIRTGLDFKDTLHGRSSGNGCYHSQNFHTSITYARPGPIWPNSALQVDKVICLNEIINLPDKFISRSPHLVVQYVDWIQCRYLFALKVNGQGMVSLPRALADIPLHETQDSSFERDNVNQDPQLTVRGPANTPLRIPVKSVTSIPTALCRAPQPKRPRLDDGPKNEGSNNINSPEQNTNESGRQDKMAEVSDLSTENPPPPAAPFKPNQHDVSLYRLMEPPSYASPQSTKLISRELRALQNTLDQAPLDELGWYINTESITNVYQWLVELHSFDPDLPLARDMAAAQVSSVLLEIRFGVDTPFSPPFVRVVYPRFLTFAQGGGGHVTSGGSICHEMLTNSGWMATLSIESVLQLVRSSITSTEPQPARLESTNPEAQRDYGLHEAIDAYKRVAMAHGWSISQNFGDLS